MSGNADKKLSVFSMPGHMAMAAAVFVCVILTSSPLLAATASYVSPAVMTEAERIALGTSGDDAGFLITLDETLELVFDEPYATTNGENVSIFTLPPAGRGVARAWVSFGVYNDGAPTIVRRRNIRAGRTLSINSLFADGCNLFGGCDYIAITTFRTRRGAAGVEVDYVTVDGEVVQVTSPTPEPQTWALMILAFIGTAMRLKQVRKRDEEKLALV